VYEDGEVSVGAGVDSVEVDAQTQLVAAGGRVEARAVQRASRRAGRLATTSGHLADRPHVRTDVLPAYRQVTANQKTVRYGRKTTVSVTDGLRKNRGVSVPFGYRNNTSSKLL